MSDLITPTRLRELCSLSNGNWGPPHPNPGQCHSTRCRAADTIEALTKERNALAEDIAIMMAERDALAHKVKETECIIKACGHEMDALRSQALASECRRREATHRAQRIVLDEELRATNTTLTAERDALAAGLRSIANSSCCSGCQEAALVAKSALRKIHGGDHE